MLRSTGRVLALLEILQTGGTRTTAELARRLEVDERTVRRYVAHLVELDVPVETVRGRYGGYRLAAGYRMPPLMLTDEEALALLLGVLAARRVGLATVGEAGESAAAKVRRVLPAASAVRLDALLETLEVTAPPGSAVGTEAGTLLLAAVAARERRPLAIGYVARNGRESERTVLPYGVVAHAGRWYVAGHDSDSGEVRTFRLDRVRRARLRPGAFNVPAGFDAARVVLEGLAGTPWRHRVRVRVHASVTQVRSHFPPELATVRGLEEEAGWVVLEMRAERLDWIPPLLAALDRPLVVEAPEELRDLLRALATRLAGYAGA